MLKKKEIVDCPKDLIPINHKKNSLLHFPKNKDILKHLCNQSTKKQSQKTDKTTQRQLESQPWISEALTKNVNELRGEDIELYKTEIDQEVD